MNFACSFRRTLALSLSALLICALAAPAPVSADAGPFADFAGSWTGTGKIRVKGKDPERLRCRANYRPRGSSEREIDLQLSCDSDSYKFDLVGQFQADEKNSITGRWSENSRNVGGTAIGSANGNRLDIHVESSAFTANLALVTRARQQAINFDAHGGGQDVDSSITLHR